MKPSPVIAIALAVCMSACAKATGSGAGQASSSLGRSLWKREDSFVSMLSKKQDANLLRLAQQRAAEEALEKQTPSQRVPPSMYRTTEPPLPEPDLSLPVPDVPRPAPNASPRSEQ